MEIELKYLVVDDFTRERIMKDDCIRRISVPGSGTENEMHAVYFDTDDGALRNLEMVFRVRSEGERVFATLKWKANKSGTEEGAAASKMPEAESAAGLHVRGELNVPADEQMKEKPSIDIFRGSEIYGTLAEITAGRQLKPVLDMKYTRREVRIDTGKSICAVSLDEGEIITANGNLPIRELEIELYSGDCADMQKFGRELAAKYNLIPEEKSKYQRGAELLGLI